MSAPISPLPLVTATFTTDELAKFSAGLMQLRKAWAVRASEYRMMRDEKGEQSALTTIDEITALINRVAGLVTTEQGEALLTTLIREQQGRDKR